MFASVFQWLLGSPLVAFERGQLELLVPWGVFWVVAALVGASVFFLLGYRRLGGRLGKRGRLLLGVVRAAAIAVVLLCLFRPQLVLSLVVPQENVVGVLFDDSRSMQIADAGDGRQRGEVLRAAFPDASDGDADPSALGPALREKFVTRLFRFSETIERVESTASLRFAGARTDLGGNLARVADELGSLPLAGVVLLSDGADTVAAGDEEFDRILLDLRARGIRVYPVPLGQPEFAMDLELAAPDVPSRVPRGSLLEIRLPLRARGLAGRTARVEALDEGRIIATETVRFTDDAVETTVTMLAPAEEAGARRLRFRVAPFPGEVLTRNNERSVLVEVEDRPLKLLYFEGQPRWELKFLRRAVAGDPEIQLACLLRTAEGKFYRVDVANAEELAGGFPATREELFGYAGIILGSVEASFFSQDQLNMLRDFVSQRGGGLLTLGGAAAYSEGGYRDTPLAEVLPLSLPEPVEELASPDRAPAARDRAPAARDRAPAAPVRELRILPTRAGSLHPVVRLDPDPLANDDLYRSLPPLSSVNRIAGPKPGAAVLLEGLGPGDAPEPVLLIQRFGRGRVASLTIQDLWVWQMDATIPVEDQTHELLSRRLLRWLASDAPRRLEVSTTPTKSLVGERVTLRARVEDERFLAVNGAVAEAAVTGPDGAVSVVPLRWTGQGDGEYFGVHVTASAGLHRVEVRAEGAGLPGGAENPGAATWFEAGTVDDEFFDAEADPELLSRIASATGGRVFDVDEAEQLVLDLSLAESGTTVVERRELWNVPAVFLLLFGLMATEWGVRQARGLP